MLITNSASSSKWLQMAKTINADMPERIHRQLRIERARNDETNSEIVTKALAQYYDEDAQDAIERLHDELSAEEDDNE